MPELPRRRPSSALGALLASRIPAEAFSPIVLVVLVLGINAAAQVIKTGAQRRYG